MARLVDTTLASLRGNDHDAIDDAAIVALSFLEKHAGGRLGEPLCPEVLKEEVTDADIINLRDTLIDLINTRPLDDYASTAAFVLGKWEDRTAIPALVEFMKLSHENARTRAVWNALNALDHLGEDVFARADGAELCSCHDIERHRELAERYLKKKDHLCQ